MTSASAPSHPPSLPDHLLAAFNLTSDSVFILDKQWRFLFLNGRAKDLLSPGTDLVGRNVWETFPGLESTDFGTAYKSAAAAGSRSSLTAFYEPFQMWIEAHALPTEHGLTVAYRDVSEKRTAEEKLRLSEESLRFALFAGAMVAWEYDPAAQSLTLSENSGHTLALESCSLADFGERILVEDRQLAMRAVAIGVPAKFRVLHPDGRIIWVKSEAASVAREGRLLQFGTFKEITAEEEAGQRLWVAAHRDDVTDLPNRLHFKKELQSAIAAMKCSGEPFSLALLDLDMFKEVNDSAGHEVGDELLREAGRRLGSFTSKTVFVARCGGDEFSVLLRGVRPREALENMKSLLDAMQPQFSYRGLPLLPRASIGLAHAPEHGSDPTEIMKAADLALFAAKEAGRNRVETFTGVMRASLQTRLSTRRMIRSAISEGRLLPHYQPMVCLSNGRIHGFEALARCRLPKRVEPAKNFAAALDYPDIALDVSKVMVTAVIEQIAQWTAEKLPFGHVAINLSEADFAYGGIADELIRRLDEKGLAGSCLQVEITESVLLSRSESDLLCQLELLRRRGVELALDDFGTGYASLTHLKKFPVSTLKLDQTFVRDLCTDRHSHAIASAIIGLGSNLGLAIVAEGIETSEQLATLLGMGCTHGQGYLFAKPMPPSTVREYLRSAEPVTAGDLAVFRNSNQQSPFG
ncbi:MAG: hypothetical protein JWM36_4447 [Hyphomicrobiales bacterium]|nr:hypothetical protein [Hyphomicrobiales bacterium]